MGIWTQSIWKDFSTSYNYLRMMVFTNSSKQIMGSLLRILYVSF